MTLVITYRRVCDGCGDTMTPKQPMIGMSEADANKEALDVGYCNEAGFWFCPRCQENGTSVEESEKRRQYKLTWGPRGREHWRL